MVKMGQKYVINLSDRTTELSIFESRKQIRLAHYALSGGLHPRSTPQRIGQRRKADQRGLRKSSSLTNGMSPGRNKTALGEYAKGGPRSFLLPASQSMRPSWATPVNGSL
jgi:hypothetical protein